jgi:methyl-accepting chemotaxis protein
MDIIADILLIAGALAAAAYCIILSRRLKQLNDLEKGVGGAIAVLSAQVDDMTKTLSVAQKAATGSNDSLSSLTERAEEVSKRLELLVASMHDLPAVGESSAVNAEDASQEATEGSESAGFRSARSATGRAAA